MTPHELPIANMVHLFPIHVYRHSKLVFHNGLQIRERVYKEIRFHPTNKGSTLQFYNLHRISPNSQEMLPFLKP